MEAWGPWVEPCGPHRGGCRAEGEDQEWTLLDQRCPQGWGGVGEGRLGSYEGASASLGEAMLTVSVVALLS